MQWTWTSEAGAKWMQHDWSYSVAAEHAVAEQTGAERIASALR